jgi:RNA polymerase sigma factor (sigma-70 family)
MSGPAPAIFVVDDEPSVRTAIARVLRAAGLTVSTCASAQEYLEGYDPAVPGCVVLDLAMPGFSGLDLQQALAARGDAPPIVFLSGHADVPASVQAMKRGAVEFLTKPVDERALIDAVRNALESDRIDRSARAQRAEIRRQLATLTPRESQVLSYVVAGMTNKQTAAELGTVEKTIKVHRSRIMHKLKVQSLAQLVQLAARAGITSGLQG